MNGDRLDPGGPILGRLARIKSSPELVELATTAGLVFDLTLSDRDDYSHATRVRAYLKRVQASLAKLSEDSRLASLSTLARELVSRGIVEESALVLELEHTGWRLHDGRIMPMASGSSKTASLASTPRTAVILTALPLEAQAVIEHLMGVREEEHSKGTIYTCGLLVEEVTSWRVAILTAGMGNPAAALEVERAIAHFQPEIVLLVGVAGGLKDVKLGDVVAADKVHAYERGKAGEGFAPRPESWPGGYAAVQRAMQEARKGNWRQRILGVAQEPPPDAIVRPIAAGEKVVASDRAAVYELIRQAYGDAVAVEMEGAGFLLGTHANSGVDALVIRGISDLVVNKQASDEAGWQQIAATHAAAFAVEFLLRYRPERDRERPSPSSAAIDNRAPAPPPPSLVRSIQWRPPQSNENRPGYSGLFHAVFMIAGTTKRRARAYVEIAKGADIDTTRVCISKGFEFQHEWSDLRPEEPYLIPVFTTIAAPSSFWLDSHIEKGTSTKLDESPIELRAGTYIVDESFLLRLHRAPMPDGGYRLRVKLVLGDTRHHETLYSDWFALDVNNTPTGTGEGEGTRLAPSTQAEKIRALRELRREVIHNILNVAAPSQETRGDLEREWIPKAQDWDARVERTMIDVGCEPEDVEFVRDFPLPALRRQDFTYPMNSQWAISDTRREKLEAVIDSLLGRQTFRR